MTKNRPTGVVWDDDPVEMTEEEYFVFRGNDEPVVKPHGGACNTCGQTKPDVYEDRYGTNWCNDCARHSVNRAFEFREEKISFLKRKYGGAR